MWVRPNHAFEGTRRGGRSSLRAAVAARPSTYSLERIQLMDPTILVEVPSSKRIRKSIAMVVLTLGVSGLAFAYAYSQDQIDAGTLWLLPFLLLGLFLSYRYWTTTHVAEVTPEAKQRALAEQSFARRKAEELNNKWYVRYPLAGLMFWGAWHLLETKPDRWWLAAIMALFAAFFAREISLFVIAIGAIYLLFQGVASLPVSVAIIIGAIIIASAVKK